ncbi:dihydrofolate reductase family protein [Corallococcus sp. BB11-1]|uniref:dihydrofolate reductase family protein n=1 Tax=Corallococcus sp. BB11-1 TaxID=2996783 RepID=UPI0010D394C1|nr:dihydrofolate reductase family protein [Corallococcus sp. BB11-1]MCY1034961.1 dihydrofolate reductase family protein [Corallococcus sp. BB11-1]RYZ46142.1 MAG: dihydrofolate reductase [Myxococcaceae bacterium]
MRRLTYYVASTLDGFIASPQGAYDFFKMEPDYLDAIAAEYPETLPASYRAFRGLSGPGQHFDTVLEGRNTYQVGLDAGVTNAYPHLEHYVFSRTLTQSPDPKVTISTTPLATVRELKAREGRGIWLCGGGALAAELRPEIDAYVIKLNPVIVGSGIKLVDTGFSPQRLQLTGVRALASGVVFLNYVRQPA